MNGSWNEPPWDDAPEERALDCLDEIINAAEELAEIGSVDTYLRAFASATERIARAYRKRLRT